MKALTAVCFLLTLASAVVGWGIEVQLLLHPGWTDREWWSFIGVAPLTAVSTAYLFQFRRST